MTTTLYETLLGTDFATLPAAVRRFHRLQGQHLLAGKVVVAAPESFAARLLARLVGMPTRHSASDLRFYLSAAADRETWIRYFPEHTMSSELSLHGPVLQERLGPATLKFNLVAEQGALVMELRKLRVFGIPCPRWAMPRVVARETGSEHQLHFEVSASLPRIGQIVRYVGHLEVPAG